LENDGTTLNSNDVIILQANRPPTHTNPILRSDPILNQTFDDLICYNQSTSDPDSDPVKNIFNWYRNDSSIILFNMPFEGGSTSGTLGQNGITRDYSGLGNNGTVINATWNSTAGYDGFGAYEFDGGDDHIRLPDDAFNNYTEGAVEVWFKPNSISSSRTYIVSANTELLWANTRFWFGLREVAGEKKFDCEWFGTDALTRIDFLTDEEIIENKWHHAVYTTNSSGNWFYLNGVQANITYSNGVIGA